MDFPISHLLDSQACYDELALLLHPGGLRCPNGHALAQCYVPDFVDRPSELSHHFERQA